MENKQKRTPLYKKPLRMAGQSLDNKMTDIVNDIMSYVFVIFFISILTIIEWISFYFPFPDARWIYSFLALIYIVYSVLKILPKIKEGKQIKLGMEGEKIVAEVLDELRVDGYKVYNDVINNNFNIDHVIVGPAGVFTVETKTWKKGKDKNIISYDESNIRINGKNCFKNPIDQARGQVYWLSRFIEEKTKTKIRVRPVIIFPGWFVEPMKRGADVWILNEKSLKTFLKNEEKILSSEQINFIASHIEDYNRNI